MLKKIILLAVIFAALSFSVNVQASDVTPTEVPSPTPTAMPNPYSKLIVRSDGSINLSNVFESYFNLLTNDQQDLCNYLIGLSNYMYLTARGFTYETVSTSQQLISMLCAFGDRFFQVVPNEFSSRLTPYMQNYVAACVTYAAKQDDINGNLGAWIDNHQDDLYIPYSDNALAGWTAFYNDPSNLGVASWGDYSSPWVSGIFYDFEFSNYPWYNSTNQTNYNNFILNNSPVLYTNVYNNGSYQMIYSIANNPSINSLYILRSANNLYSSYTWGNENGRVNNFSNNRATVELYRGKLYFNSSTYGYSNYIYNSNSPMSLDNLIIYAFSRCPWNDVPEQISNWYPYIEHVYLVDDLSTLSNKQEISNVEGFDINSDNAKWIQTPKGQVLYYPIGSGATLVEFPLPEYLKKDDGNGNLIDIDDNDLENSVVNNTVINNYNIVAPGVTINVPVDWFNSEGNYLEYTYNYGLPFFVFVGDVFTALGELRIIILGVLIFGLVSGIIVKFLQ